MNNLMESLHRRLQAIGVVNHMKNESEELYN